VATVPNRDNYKFVCYPAVAAAAFTRFPKPRNRSDLGVQIKVNIVVEISVLWSVTFPLMALTRFVKTVLSTIHQFKEFVMSKLHEMVLFGVALLSDLGELMRINLGDAPYAQRLMAVKTYDLPRRQRTGVQFPRPALISGRWRHIGSQVKAIEQGGQP